MDSILNNCYMFNRYFDSQLNSQMENFYKRSPPAAPAPLEKGAKHAGALRAPIHADQKTAIR